MSSDPFNMSNDEHYNPKLMDSAIRSSVGVSLIQVKAFKPDFNKTRSRNDSVIFSSLTF